jgi:DHA2 family multidrug resistance protein
VLAGLGIYLFVVHLLTGERPFIPPRIFRDANFAGCLGVMFIVGVVLLATSALLLWRGYVEATFVVATLGVLAWFLNVRSNLPPRDEDRAPDPDPE